MNTDLALAVQYGNLFPKRRGITGKLRLLACVTLFFSAIAMHTADSRRMMEMAQGTMTAVQNCLGLTLRANANASLSRAMHVALEVERLMDVSVQILSTPNLKLPEQTVNKILLSIDQIYSDVLLGPHHVQPSITSDLLKAREFIITFQHMLNDSLRGFDQGRAVETSSGYLSSLSPHLNVTAIHVPHQTEMGREVHVVSQSYGLGTTEYRE